MREKKINLKSTMRVEGNLVNEAEGWVFLWVALEHMFNIFTTMLHKKNLLSSNTVSEQKCLILKSAEFLWESNKKCAYGQG